MVAAHYEMLCVRVYYITEIKTAVWSSSLSRKSAITKSFLLGHLVQLHQKYVENEAKLCRYCCIVYWWSTIWFFRSNFCRSLDPCPEEKSRPVNERHKTTFSDRPVCCGLEAGLVAWSHKFFGFFAVVVVVVNVNGRPFNLVYYLRT